MFNSIHEILAERHAKISNVKTFNTSLPNNIMKMLSTY